MKKPTHGGRREGAGRKVGSGGPKKQVSLWVSEVEAEFLRVIGGTVQEGIRKLLKDAMERKRK